MWRKGQQDRILNISKRRGPLGAGQSVSSLTYWENQKVVIVEVTYVAIGKEES